MSTAKIRIALMVEQEARKVTGDDGHFDQKTLTDAVRERLKNDTGLTPDIKDQVEIDAAANYARAFVERRKPKLDRETGGLFNPAFVLPLGEGKRVWMDWATTSDVVSWAALESANTAKILLSSGTRQRYVAERLTAFVEHPDWTLGQVERESFGWVETAEPLDDDEVEEGE